MGKINYFDIKMNEELLTDDLVERAFELLEERYGKMSDWIKDNSNIITCDKCGKHNLEYRHDGIRCLNSNCGHFMEIDVPYPGQGGVVGSRRLFSIILELFAMEMGKKRKEEKLKKDQLRHLKFDINRFDTGEYTEAEIDFLERRYQELVEENNIINPADKFLVRAVVIQELKLMNVEREITIGNGISENNLKKLYDIYDKLVKSAKLDKSSRENEDDYNALREMEKEAVKHGVDEELNKLINQKEEMLDFLENSKIRREEVGNEF